MSKMAMFQLKKHLVVYSSEDNLCLLDVSLLKIWQIFHRLNPQTHFFTNLAPFKENQTSFPKV